VDNTSIASFNTQHESIIEVLYDDFVY